MVNKVRIVEVTNGEKPLSKTQNCFRSGSTFYKIQEKHLGIWWDHTEPEYGMLWPTFDTLEEAEEWVSHNYYQSERVVKEYTFKWSI